MEHESRFERERKEADKQYYEKMIQRKPNGSYYKGNSDVLHVPVKLGQGGTEDEKAE